MSSQDHLSALPLELHTHIFSNLQPHDILQVLQTCQALYLASSQRTVWLNALRRICVENSLFEPSYPVASMSVLELQRASMGPHRWIARLSSKRNSDGVLPHSVTRHLMSAMSDIPIAHLQSSLGYYLVPGGRYLFSFPLCRMVLWDLGSPYSSDKEPHIITTEFVESYSVFHVHPAPDGTGVRVIFLRFRLHDDMTSVYVYEVYPESTAPKITQIANTQITGADNLKYSLSYDRVTFEHDGILTVWGYKANMWARWGVGCHGEILLSSVVLSATKSAAMFIHRDGVSVWEIPPLLPASSLSMSTDPPFTSPAFELRYLENQPFYQYHRVVGDWYFGTPQHLYYDAIEDGVEISKINRFKVVINSEISGGSLNLLKTFQVLLTENHEFCRTTRICQDKTFSICTDIHRPEFLGTHVIDIYDQQLLSCFTPLCRHPIRHLTFCTATSRLVYLETDLGPPSLIVLDF